MAEPVQQNSGSGLILAVWIEDLYLRLLWPVVPFKQFHEQSMLPILHSKILK